MQRAAERLLCHDEPAAPQSVSFDETGNGLGGTFDRQGYVHCRPFSFSRGDRVTAFAFSDIVWAADIDPFPQHSMFLFYFTPTDRCAHTPIHHRLSPHDI